MYTNKNFGLVLSGGGAKGAYQIGVWKALDELELTPLISAVSGSSVGALNALMFSRQNRHIATQIWNDVRQKDMLYTDDISKAELVEKTISSLDSQCNLGIHAPFIEKIIKLDILTPKFMPVLTILKPLIKAYSRYSDFDYDNIVRISDLITYSLTNGALFSQKGLDKIITDFFLLSYHTTSLSCYATLASNSSLRCFLSGGCEEYVKLDSLTLTEQKDVVLASSALPLIYPRKEIDGCKFFDGGWVDNYPVRPLYDRGYRDIIIVYLENNNHNKLRKQFEKERKQFSDCNIIRIIPNRSFKDGIYETLSISRRKTAKRIETGYTDALEQLKAQL